MEGLIVLYPVLTFMEVNCSRTADLKCRMWHSTLQDRRRCRLEGRKWLEFPARHQSAKSKMSEYSFNRLFKGQFDCRAFKYSRIQKFAIFSVLKFPGIHTYTIFFVYFIFSSKHDLCQVEAAKIFYRFLSV